MLTVVTPATSHRLATVAAVRSEIAAAGAPVTDDAVSALIDQVSAAIEAWCSRTFGVQVVQEDIWPCASTTSLMLSLWPVLPGASVTLDGTPADPSTFRIDPNGFLVATPLNAWSFNEALVIYSAGYVLPSDEPDAPAATLPLDVQRAAILAVKEACFAVGRDPALRSDEVAGIGSVQYALNSIGVGSVFRPEIEGLLARYRVPVLG